MIAKVLCVFPGSMLEESLSWVLETLPEAHFTPVTWLKDHKKGDLAFEDFSSPKNLFNHVQPQLILFKSISSYHEIAVNRYAQLCNIPTILIGHGDNSLEAANNIIYLNRPILNSRIDRWKHVLSFYILSAPMSEWGDRINYLIKAVKTGNPYEAVSVLKNPIHRADFALALTDSAKEVLMEKLGYPKARVRVMGDPLAVEVNLNIFSNEYVLFIDSDLEALKDALPETHDPWYELFSQVFCLLPPEIPLLIRLHPNTPADKYHFVQNIPGVSISHDRTPVEDIAGASLVCGFRSTLLSLALTMDKPVLLADEWNTYFPAFSEEATGLYIKASQIVDKTSSGPWPSPSALNKPKLELLRKVRGYGLPALEIARNLFQHSLSA
jgi:hypothetical protein